jgi:hypothetical protein
VNGRFFQIAIPEAANSVRCLLMSGRRFGSLTCLLLLSALVALSALKAAEGPNAPMPSAQTASAQLQGVRFFSQSSHTCVVIDLSADVRYKVGHLSNPERLYFDLLQTAISHDLTTRQIAVRDAVVDQIRIGVGQSSVTRVVLDLHSAAHYQVSQLNDPARMLVDLDRTVDQGKLAESTKGQADGRGTPAGDLATLKMNSTYFSVDQAPNPQGTPPRSDQELGPQTYGNGEKASLNYAGTVSPRNVLLFGLDFGTSYDDNIFGNNQQRVGDIEFSIGPSISLRREANRLSFALIYQPHVRIYRNASELNTLDQRAGLDASYRATSRLSFRGRASATYSNGLFRPSQNEDFLPGLGSPSSLNQTIYTPTLHQLSFSSRVDAGYQVGPRDSIDLYAGESLLNFDQQVSNEGSLGNTRETDAGLLYQHRISPHATLGLDYLFQNIDFGPSSQTEVHSGFVSYAQQFSPSVTVSLFGGPQHSLSNYIFSLALGPFLIQAPVSSPSWNWALGGTLTKRLNNTVLELTAQHQVSNGGGLIGAVVGTSAGASVRHRLPGHWDAVWSGSYAKNNNLVSSGPTSDYQSETVGFSLVRPVTDRLSLRFGYDFLHQRGTGQSPLLGEVDRNLFSVQFSYGFRQIALNQ